MGFRTGFGVVKGSISLNNPKMVCLLTSNLPQHITSITASFIIQSNEAPPTSMDGALVQVLNGNFDDKIDDSPDPNEVESWNIASLNNSSPQSICVWESRFNDNAANPAGVKEHWYFGERGIYIPAKTAHTVILSAPTTNQTPLPSGIGSMYIGVLSVVGWIEEKGEPFKDLRPYQNA